jgi:hypothetical protein
MSEGNSINLKARSSPITSFMNYPYSSLILEAQSAKRELSRAFQSSSDRGLPCSVLPHIQGGVATKDDQPDLARPPRTAARISPLRELLNHPRKRVRFPNGFYWMHEDMGPVSFILTLILLGAVTAAQTDHPVFWLLVGPTPLATGFFAVTFFRRRILLRKCQCQCQCP